MKVACLSFTLLGSNLGEKLESLNNEEFSFYHFANENLKGGVKGFLRDKWLEYEGFIFISASGIAVRMIHPYIKDKKTDPGVLVIDDMGKFVISLLSGHIGGANELTSYVANKIGATPVISTASDSRGIDSVDLFAKDNNYFIEDIGSLTKITAHMVNGKSIGFYTEDGQGIKYDKVIFISDLNSIPKDLEGLIIVSSKLDIKKPDLLYTILRPKVINIGIGARKDIKTSLVIEAIENALKEKGLSKNSIRSIGTVDVKAEEKGIIKGAEYFKSPLKIFTREEIRLVQDKFQKSQFVEDTLGVTSVSEPCAYLLGGKIILSKYRYKGVTVSLAIL